MRTTPPWPEGYRHIHFETIDSTNDEARRRAIAGEAGPVWITADEQMAGRGRRGRVWVSPQGNLMSTLLLNPQKAAAECAQLSFVSAIAAADAVVHFAPESEVKVKWPNDVLANGRKISGILLESASAGGEPYFLAIGIGINLAHFPQDTEFPATSLAWLGVPVPPGNDALTQLAASFAKWYDVWRGQGFAPIRDAWLARAANLGGRIRARLTKGETSGVFEGIDETGALLLREASDRLRVIAAGEVFF
ncbi:MAG TPA: biotin--[acetyl-CoA-carboxylase] ligase [Rhizomicrobium sp.]|nr:biotin--[acetyl-CoA-carboxylase] ligase [Rhizomicrobium sp.]